MLRYYPTPQTCYHWENSATKTQRLVNFETYLTEPLATALQAEGTCRAKLRELAVHLSKLGLRNPSEKTVQSVVAVYLALAHGMDSAQTVPCCVVGTRNRFLFPVCSGECG